MLGIITLLIALAAQIGLLSYRLLTNDKQFKVTLIIRTSAFTVFSLLLLLKVYWWGFRWVGLFVVLLLLALFSVKSLVWRPKQERTYTKLRTLITGMSGCVLLTAAILPGILFPQFQNPTPSGVYEVSTTSATFIDNQRIDPYSKSGDNRKLSVQFWYPAVESSKFPLVVFSHGAFGYRGSNYSTFEELASNGYVVCSIDHSYHAFFAEHTDGSSTIVNTEFLNTAIAVSNGAYDPQKTFIITRGWLQLRSSDMSFVLDEILANTNQPGQDNVYSLIDSDKIGLFGHSLGGATAAQLGRIRSDIDAVVVIDGTMLGEQAEFVNGKPSFNQTPYPVPLLNLYNDNHYVEAMSLGTAYANVSACTNAIESYDVVVRSAGHLNFTDLPLFSPVLARMLGTGDVNSRYCIETMNKTVLDFFDYTLKGNNMLQLSTEY